MPTKIEKDQVTGTETTGHEWDGIKELNTPLPRWWLYVLYATIVWSVIWWLLYPSWPGITGYFAGILGYDQREALNERIAEAEAERASYMDRLADASLEQITADPELMDVAFRGGDIAFRENCAPCHGLGGAGQGHYPTLADDAWLWGGTPDAIHTTLLYGIRSDHPDTRFNLMPAYGVDGLLDRAQIDDVAEFVLSLSGQSENPEAAERGAEIFAQQCRVPRRGRHGHQRHGGPEPRRCHLAVRGFQERDRRPDPRSAARRHAGVGRTTRSGDDQESRDLRPFARRRPVGRK